LSPGSGEPDNGSGAFEFDGLAIFLDGGGLVLLGVKLDEREALPSGIVELDDVDRLRMILREDGPDIVFGRPLRDASDEGRVTFVLARRPRRPDDDVPPVDLDRLMAREGSLSGSRDFEIDETAPARDELAPEVRGRQYIDLLDDAEPLEEFRKILRLCCVFDVAEVDLKLTVVNRHETDWPD
jgi:hypothetical protein